MKMLNNLVLRGFRNHFLTSILHYDNTMLNTLNRLKSFTEDLQIINLIDFLTNTNVLQLPLNQKSLKKIFE